MSSIMGNTSSTNNKLALVVVTDKRKAQALLDKAEKTDYYLEECYDNKMNSIARRNMTYSANAVSSKDAEYAKQFIETVYFSIPGRLLSDLGTVQIVQLMPSADGGMPHTRPGNIICYPDFSQLFSKTTLIHELWHIHQREHQEEWLKTFSRLGWTVWNGKLPEQLESARRYNPDTLDFPLWIFDKTWVPIPIFRDISRPNVAEVDIWFYNPEKRYHVKQVPNEIATYFQNLPPSAYEHPREIAAYMLSDPEKYKSCQGFKHLIESIGQVSIMSSQNLFN
jgi:hypothetical protein